MKKISTIIMFLVVLNAYAIDHTFSYQGQLTDAGSPANGTYDVAIQAFDAVQFGNTVGDVSVHNGVNVSDGVFTIEAVDLGSNTFDGLDIWLQISVKRSIDSNYTALSPLQKLRSVPYATSLIDKGASDGQVLTFDTANGWQPADVASSSDNQNIQGLSLSGTNLTVGIENGTSQNVDLSSLQDGTGTDDQNIASLGLVGTSLTVGIENGNSQNVDLASLQDGTGTDNQDLSLSGTTLNITNGTSASFSGWDTNASDDFSGNYNDLSNQPWSFDGVNTSRDSGFTGIGLTNPAANLHIKMSTSGNISGGIRLETASPTTGEDWYIHMPASDDLVFRNDAVTVLTMKKDTGDVEMTGELHANVTGDADMKAYIYGHILFETGSFGGSSTTSIVNADSTSGFDVENVSNGIFKISFTDTALSSYVVSATTTGTMATGLGLLISPAFIVVISQPGYFTVYTYNQSGDSSSTSFNFVVYKK